MGNSARVYGNTQSSASEGTCDLCLWIYKVTRLNKEFSPGGRREDEISVALPLSCGTCGDRAPVIQGGSGACVHSSAKGKQV